MRPMLLLPALLILAAAPSPAGADVLGLYFSDTVFGLETADATVTPGFTLGAYVVLTAPSGAVVTGHEVAITCTAADFSIPVTSLFFDQNLGTSTNQVVTYMFPKPVAAGGTVLAFLALATASLVPETISFGAAVPSSLPGALPVVRYESLGPVACSLPYSGDVVAWLNGQPVAEAPVSWGGVKALFR